MSWAEWGLFVTGVGGIGFLLASARMRWREKRVSAWIGLTVMLGLMIAHAGIDGLKWKWGPFYALLLVLVCRLGFMVYRKEESEPPKKRRGARLRVVLGIAGLMYAGLSFYVGRSLLPAISLDTPGGPYAVGTTAFHWKDASREETYTAERDDHREIQVRLWYPAQVSWDAAKADYGFSSVPGGKRGEAPFLFHIIAQSNRNAKAHAFPDAPLSPREEAYPVVVFAPGYGASNFMYATFAEELASQGYIVAGIQHPYFTLFPTRLSGGRVAAGMFDAGAAGDWALSEKLIRQILVKDVRFAIDRLELLNQGAGKEDGSGGAPYFASRMDFSRLGIMGHSFGGTVAAQTMDEDPRIRAGINMDGFLYGKRLDNGLDRPFMYMFTGLTDRFEKMGLTEAEWGGQQTFAFPSVEEYAAMAREQAERHRLLLQNGGYNVLFPKADHFDFSDTPLYSPLLGSGHTRELHDTVNELALAFFERHLNGRESALLQKTDAKLYSLEVVDFEK
ncbi:MULTISPECIES: hypothetical protein [Paenibacillus]|uniref:alpha/beta hydrolase family protein n=1 Tax=Paenibacillus TaxID=44249 RepID=UPI002FE161E2